MRELGFPAEKLSFNPHLTIARIREPQKSLNLAVAHLANRFEPIEFEVSEIVVYESKLQPTGSVYLDLANFKLG